MTTKRELERSRAPMLLANETFQTSVDEIIGEFLDSFAAVPLPSELKMDRSNAISPDEREIKCLSATATTRY